MGISLFQLQKNNFSILGCIALPECLGKLHVKHPLVVVCSLIAPVILGVDFLQKHGLTLDFTSNPVGISSQIVDEDMVRPKILNLN